MSFTFVGIPVFIDKGGYLRPATDQLAAAVTLPTGGSTTVTQSGAVTSRPRSDAAGRMTFTHADSPVVLVDMGDGRAVPLFALELITQLKDVPGAMAALEDAQAAAASSADSASAAEAAAGSLQIGTVSSLESGSSATASISVDGSTRLLNLGLPAGPVGPSGVTKSTADFAAKLTN